jgi:hypothetical protein
LPAPEELLPVPDELPAPEELLPVPDELPAPEELLLEETPLELLLLEEPPLPSMGPLGLEESPHPATDPTPTATTHMNFSTFIKGNLHPRNAMQNAKVYGSTRSGLATPAIRPAKSPHQLARSPQVDRRVEAVEARFRCHLRALALRLRRLVIRFSSPANKFAGRCFSQRKRTTRRVLSGLRPEPQSRSRGFSSGLSRKAVAPVICGTCGTDH